LVVSLVAFCATGCGASAARYVLESPISERCTSAGLKGCPQITDGILLVVEGDKEGGTAKPRPRRERSTLRVSTIPLLLGKRRLMPTDPTDTLAQRTNALLDKLQIDLARLSSLRLEANQRRLDEIHMASEALLVATGTSTALRAGITEGETI